MSDIITVKHNTRMQSHCVFKHEWEQGGVVQARTWSGQPLRAGRFPVRIDTTQYHVEGEKPKEEVKVEEYAGTFSDFVTGVEKVFIFKAASDKDAAQKCRDHFNIHTGRVDLMAGYIETKNREWLISFNARSWLKKSAWDRYVAQAETCA